MSILGTTANYTVTIQAPSSADDPFELVQGAHFMKLLMAQLRPMNTSEKKKGKDVLEQLARFNLHQEVTETSQQVNATGQARVTAVFPKKDGQF
jgi:hypothetical protein